MKTNFIEFFHDFIQVYSPEARANNSSRRNFDVNRNILSLRLFVACFKKMSLKSDFIHFFLFHDLIHVYSPGAGIDSPRGQNVDVNRKALSLYPFVANFKEIYSKSDFL